MTAEGYAQLTRWWRAHPAALGVLIAVNSGLKYLGYLVYPLLLVLLALSDTGHLLVALAFPLAGFVLTTVLRIVVGERRPYEALDIEPLIHKDTVGKSFPSRHMYSIAAIAMAWASCCVPVGVCLLALTAVMGWIRVLGGVHYTHDVIAGALLGLAFGAGCFIAP